MHPWTIAIAGAVALSLAGTAPGNARPKSSSAVMPEAALAFWPDAPADLIEYLLFPKGQDDRFWLYGYGAIMNAAFADPAPRRPSLAGKFAGARVADASAAVRPAESSSTTDPCGGGSAAADADTWLARIEQAITPAAPQREVLQQLRSALVQAIERIKSACPGAPPATPTERLQAVQDRIWAMRDALLTIRQPFESFYHSLTQEQHWRLNRDSDAREIGARTGDGRSDRCADPAGINERPMRAIERAVRPTEQQRASLDTLRLGSAAMARLIMSACPTYPLLGHMGRFAAVSDRLDVMLFAVMTMAPAVQGFYGSLDDRQRAGFHRAMRQLRRSDPARAGS
jgi:LTXXQ motif family protein